MAYFTYSEHYLQPEVDAFEEIAAALERQFTVDYGKQPSSLELATELYKYAHGCDTDEACEAYELNSRTIEMFYGEKPTEEERLNAFVLAATCELIGTGEVPYAPGFRVHSSDYHPVAIVDCNGWDQGTKEQQKKWRELRQHYGIGGSENAALNGVSPYTNNVEVWNNKMGIEKNQNEVDRTKQFIFDYGHAMEDPIANYFSAKYRVEIRNDTVMYRHPYYPWMIADLDRRFRMLNPNTGKEEEGILEIKTSSLSKREEWEIGPPIYYQYQIRHYMAVMNVDFTFILCHFGGNTPNLAEHRVDRAKSVENDIIATEMDFWLKNVLTGMKPVPNGTIATQVAVNSWYAKMADKNRPQIAIEQTFKACIEEILDLKEQISAMKAEDGALGKLEQQVLLKQEVLKQLLGEVTEGVCDNDADTFYMVTYKPMVRENLDKEALKQAYPDIYNRFATESTEQTRVMRVTKKKKSKNFVMPQNA